VRQRARALRAVPCVPPQPRRARAQAVCKALREREAALLTVQALEAELEKKARGVAALEEEGRAVFGGDKGKTRRVAGLTSDKAALEARAHGVSNIGRRFMVRFRRRAGSAGRARAGSMPARIGRSVQLPALRPVAGRRRRRAAL